MEGQSYNDKLDINVTDNEVISKSIKQMIAEMEQRGADDGFRTYDT